MSKGKDILIVGLMLILIVLGVTAVNQLPNFIAGNYSNFIIMIIAIFSVLGLGILVRSS